MANKRSRIYLIFSILFACVICFMPAFSCASVLRGETIVAHAGSDNDFAVHFIDVGQGDSIFVELPDDKTMLIDAGPRSAGAAVVDYINGLNYETIDYLILTHSDEDHSGGMPGVLENFEVKNIYRPFVLADNDKILTEPDDLDGLYSQTEINVCSTQIYANFIKLAYAETYDSGASKAKVNVNYDGLTIVSSSESEPYAIEFHSPTVVGDEKIPSTKTNGYPTKKYANSDANSISPIITVDFDGTVFMFTGDATEETEEDFLANLDEGDKVLCSNVEVLKLAHHGSSTSSSQEFLDLVSPAIAVVQCGKDNKYGHPHSEVIDRLEKMWMISDTEHYIYRNDLNGNIVISENGLNEQSAFVEDVNLYVSLDVTTGSEKPKTVKPWVVYAVLGAIILFIVICLIIKIKKKNRVTKTDIKRAKRQYNKSKKFVEEVSKRRR